MTLLEEEVLDLKQEIFAIKKQFDYLIQEVISLKKEVIEFKLKEEEDLEDCKVCLVLLEKRRLVIFTSSFDFVTGTKITRLKWIQQEVLQLKGMTSLL